MRNLRNQSGQLSFLALVVFTLVMVNVVVLVSRSSLLSQSTSYVTEDSQAVNLAEAGVDKAASALSLGSSYAGGEYSFGSGIIKTEVVDDPSVPGNKIVKSTSYIPDKVNPRVQREVQVTVARGVQRLNIPFAAQAGSGGLFLGNSARVTNGSSVYSSGPIVMGSNSSIEGNVFLASNQVIVPNVQTPACNLVFCTNKYLGETGITPEDDADGAQSFFPSRTAQVEKVWLMLKNIGSGNPGYDLNVYITKSLASSPSYPNGAPDPSQIVTQATVLRQTIASKYGWTEVNLPSGSAVIQGQRYWIVVDAANPGSGTNYFQWRLSTTDAYPAGKSAYAANWQTPGGSWNIYPGDGQFKVFLRPGIGPVYDLGPNFIEGIFESGVSSTINKSVYADSIKSLAILQEAFYSDIDLVSRVGNPGVVCPNSSCHPGVVGPTPIPSPITDAMVSSWKNEATAGGTINGDVSYIDDPGAGGHGGSCIPVWGPKRINGNVITAGCDFIVKTPIYITGDLTLGIGVNLDLDPAFGNTSGVIVVDGKITIVGGTRIRGTGASNSSLILNSEYSSDTISAVKVLAGNNQASTVIARNGTFEIVSGVNNIFERIIANKIFINNAFSSQNNLEISGNPNNPTTEILSGQGDDYSVIKGSYKSH